MLDVAIIGGGLCGLALAHSLHARHIAWALFEARPRLGGRVLTTQTPNASGQPLALDLGPTWYWPATQPSISRLVDDLGLDSLAQPDDGRVLLLDDPNRAPRALAFDAATGRLAQDESIPAQPGALHGGARRLAGGMATLIEALAGHLPAQRFQRQQVLRRLVQRDDHVELHFSSDQQPPAVWLARRVVLALPPRLAAASLQFQPALPHALQATMAATPTWMASAAKAAIPCGHAAWRDAGGAGNAWVTHAQAVLAEVFDASPPAGPAAGRQADAAAGRPAEAAASAQADAGPAALAGFIAIPAAQRPAFKRGLPLLIESQLNMLFGAQCASGEAQLMDWAEEPYTCTEADRAEDARPGAHPAYGDATLQQPLWQGRLWLGGSETARQGGGYLEGALVAAARLRRQLLEAGAGPDSSPASTTARAG